MGFPQRDRIRTDKHGQARCPVSIFIPEDYSIYSRCSPAGWRAVVYGTGTGHPVDGDLEILGRRVGHARAYNWVRVAEKRSTRELCDSERRLNIDMDFRKGATAAWRYRVLVRRGGIVQSRVRDCLPDFVAPPLVRVE